MNPGYKYVGVIPVFNEEEYIEVVLQSVLNQRPSPMDVIVVDDGSTDATPNILRNYDVCVHRIKEKRFPQSYRNLRRALNRGVALATRRNPDWEYLLKVDADSVIPPNYASVILRVMEKKPRLGVCSGVWMGGNVWRSRTSNGAVIYRREVWEAVGGIHNVPGWDTHFMIEAYRQGWYCHSLDSLKYLELRPSTRQNLREWYKTGASRYLMGFPLYHSILVGLKHIRKDPLILGSLTMIFTHIILRILKASKPFESSYHEYAKKFVYWETLTRMKNFLQNYK